MFYTHILLPKSLHVATYNLLYAQVMKAGIWISSVPGRVCVRNTLTFFGDFDLKKRVSPQSEIMYRTQQNFSPNKDSVSGNLGLSLLLLVPTREDEAFEWKQGAVFSHCSNTVIRSFPTMHQNGNTCAILKVRIDGLHSI